MNCYKTRIYAVWFVQVNGYIPTPTELATFIPLTSIVSMSFEFILGQPTCQEKAIVTALVSAGTTTIGSMIQISGPNRVQINLSAGTFLYAIVQFLVEHNGTPFVNILYSPNVT